MSKADVRPQAADPIGEATLELLQEFPAYSDLIWDRVRGLVEMRGRVLEMGCGIGSLSRRILESPKVASLDAVDVNRTYVERVAREIADPRLRTICSPAEEFRAEPGSYDRAVSINVLEHVGDDRAALLNLSRALRPGGECALLVPAHPWLYSSLDAGLSHVRRYARSGLLDLARSAGLSPLKVVHWNPLGAFGWWLNGKVLRRPVLPRGQVALYARFGMLLSRWADRVNPFPVGLSLIARLAKPGAG